MGDAEKFMKRVEQFKEGHNAQPECSSENRAGEDRGDEGVAGQCFDDCDSNDSTQSVGKLNGAKAVLTELRELTA